MPRNAIVYCALTATIVHAFAASGEPEQDNSLRVAWNDNLLTVSSPRLPGGSLAIWYLEAFCRTGSTDRAWEQTVVPHETRLVEAGGEGRRLRLRSVVEPGVTVDHIIRVDADSVTFELTVRNPTVEFVDIDWAQPCIRVETFTGLGQDEYIRRCFIFTESGLAMLDTLPRNEEARYRGGQVYVPEGINRDDVNPRPLSPVTPTENLVGCESADGTLLLAMAWDRTQELFQGIITCIHADFRIGGMKPGEEKTIQGRLYVMPNDPAALLARYRKDFGLADPTTSEAASADGSPVR